MKGTYWTACITLWVGRFCALAVAAFAVGLPWLLNWYRGFRVLSDAEYRAIQIAYYFCAVVLEWALWDMDKLMCNILAGKVFVRENVNRIRRLQWHCGCVALICLPAACFYLPLLFVVVIMAFLSLVVSVAAQVMRAAVEIREENDLTI